MIKNIFNILNIAQINNLNDEERFIFHKKILESKKMLKSCYSDFYLKIFQIEKKFKKKRYKEVRLELGSGVGFIKNFDKKIITSDVVYNKFTDKTVDANKIPYKNNKIDSIFGIFCFHHFKDPFNFLKDVQKKLKIGGLCILIEPYYGPLASVIYKKVHKSEYFNTKETFNYKIKNKTAMEKANQALSYIYFVKNKKKFYKEFPKLKIIHTSVFNNYLRFLFSGGLNFKKLLPDFLIIFIKFLEVIMSPFKKIFGIHYIIVIKKIR
jgi:SAM-dependent methyltransferase